MGRTRKSQHTTLGKSLTKKNDILGSKSGHSDRHTNDLEGDNGLKSVTQESSYEEFIATATLADKEFTAEKLNIKFISLTAKEADDVNLLTDHEKCSIVVPRRPKWNKDMTGIQLDELEKETFLNWRRHMSKLQEKDGITPFERNLEVWRQLWRVIEKSHVIVQIVDARNPLLYRCEDLEAYVSEMGKTNVLLINKADFLNEKQREDWSLYFNSIQLPHAFYSAATINNSSSKSYSSHNQIIHEEISEEQHESNEDEYLNDTKASEHNLDELHEENSSKLESELTVLDQNPGKMMSNESCILNRSELVEFLKSFKCKISENLEDDELFIVGFCGHPNVGKSSTINSLMATKKTSVSSTPGKTKHFQTLFLEENLMLCDCPGLVMPTFGGSQGEMVLGGILPIDILTNYKGGMQLLCQRIPKHILEKKYGFTLPKVYTFEDILNSYASIRGFMTVRGLPDASRAARILLKDYVNGKLLFCHPPPGIQLKDFTNISQLKCQMNIPQEQEHNDNDLVENSPKIKAPTLKKVNVERKLDDVFFGSSSSTAHIRGKQYIPSGQYSSAVGCRSLSKETSSVSDGSKPWKRHNNKNKKEKLRRVYRYLDVE